MAWSCPCRQKAKLSCAPQLWFSVIKGDVTMSQEGWWWPREEEVTRTFDAAFDHFKFNVNDTSLSLSLRSSFSHFPSPFLVSSDQIEQLHRRFKQLSGDQPTIR